MGEVWIRLGRSADLPALHLATMMLMLPHHPLRHDPVRTELRQQLIKERLEHRLPTWPVRDHLQCHSHPSITWLPLMLGTASSSGRDLGGGGQT